MAGGPERGQAGADPGHRPGGREELDVLGVGAGPATLDVGHPVFIKHARHAQLVGEGQGDVLALRAVAQGRVIEDDRLVRGLVGRLAGWGIWLVGHGAGSWGGCLLYTSDAADE